MGEREGGRRGRVRSDFRSDLSVTQTKQRRFPGLCWEKFNPCVFCVCCKLTSCSSMAVGVEAEISATKRSQVEVTKILPALWLSCCIGAAYGLCAVCVGVCVFLHHRIEVRVLHGLGSGQPLLVVVAQQLVQQVQSLRTHQVLVL